MPSFKAFSDFQKKAKEVVGSKNGEAQELRVGMWVRVKGLQARPELNGLEGVLTTRDEEKSRWKVELKDGGGAKLFKDSNLEPYISDQDALDILRAPAKEERPAPPAPAAAAAPAPERPAPSPDLEPQLEDLSRPKSFLEQSRQAAAEGPSAAAVAAAAAVAKGTKLSPAQGDDTSEVSTAPEDDEAFLKSIEQCLKECDVMWDDY
ncbi:unnamed protein product [Effrenium voratum]|uniref:Uncharacterized protein n=1 Tax=Effrenium voratum TaxID=2562239 RepID=A0AA36I7F7_9DINO|nr:unnamed protein product [Effrenium voratum]CAJ1382355.1 unnamed protein product [Effrenium voratum]